MPDSLWLKAAATAVFILALWAFWYWWKKDRHTRPRFAFYSAAAILGLATLFLAQLWLKISLFAALGHYLLAPAGIPYQPRPMDGWEVGVTLLVLLGVGIFLARLHGQWEAGDSTRFEQENTAHNQYNADKIEIHHHGPAERDGLKEELEPDDFLRRVRVACSKREPEAAVERREAPLPHVYVRKTSADFAGALEEFTVTALEHAPSLKDVEQVYRQIVQPCQRYCPNQRHWLIHRDGEAPQEVRDRARAHNLVVQSYPHYQRLLQLDKYVQLQTAELLRDEPNRENEYPPQRYIPQALHWQQGHLEKRAEDAAQTVLDLLLDSEKGRFVMVLADFGTGKTFLLRELARRLAQTPGAPYPVLIEMRGLAMRDREKNLDRLLAQQLAVADVNYQPSQFRYMLEQGKVVLLFDAYDELALRVTYEKAAEYLDMLLGAAGGEFAKVVVSSRSQHFKSDSQVIDAMRRKIEDFSRQRIVYLEKFKPEQVQQFLQRYFPADPDKAARYFRYIAHIQDLMGLSETPRMLKFIAALPEAEFQEVEARRERISAAGLYRKILNTWLAHEQQRGDEQTKDDVELPDRWRAVRLLALHLWRSGAVAVSGEELEHQLSHVKTQLEHLYKVQKLGSGTLLVRDKDDRFCFVHQSVLEWLVAEQAAATGNTAPTDNTAPSGVIRNELLALRPLSDLMLEFFIDLATRETAEHWAQTTEQNPAADDTARKNARKLLKRLEVKFSVKTYAGQDLAGENFADQDLSRADFRDSLLDGALFSRARLQGANFSAAKLRQADFSGADVTGADFTRADLRGALWAGARLEGARFDGAYGWPFRHEARTASPQRTGSPLLPELILLPGGIFKMGGDKNDDEKPVREVNIAYDFAIGRFQVTVSQFRCFVESSGYQTEAETGAGAYVYVDGKWGTKEDANWRKPYFEQDDACPVVCVSWNDAQAYCRWLSEQTGQSYRLPSEAEWEYACRAGSESEYCFGSDVERLKEYAWYHENSGGKTHPVGKLKPNTWGLHDVHGNVWEWCQDQWHDNYQGAPNDGSAWFEAEKGGNRLLRGGAWYGSTGLCRAACRRYGGDYRNGDIGFRVVCLAAART